MKKKLNKPGLKKVLGIASALFMGALAVSEALADQKKEKEFEDMKKQLSELQSKNQ